MRILYLPNSHCQQRQFEKPNFSAYPWLLAAEAEWYRKQGHFVFWGEPSFCGPKKELFDRIITDVEGLPFLSLPHPDRKFTNAFHWKYQQNGNFKYHPGTYIQAANGCWWGKCSFCVENKEPQKRWCPQWQIRCKEIICSELPFYHPKESCMEFNKYTPSYEVREVDDVIDEIKECKQLGMREVFDDSGTFPMGDWLDRFCDKLASISGIRFSCNMRMVDYDYARLRKVGFRMLLFGLESANQNTLDKINKGVKVEDVKYIIKAAKAGLDAHIAVMFGYPFEDGRESLATLRLVHYLLRKGYAKTAQASLYTPRYDSANEDSKEEARKYIRKIYDVWKSPTFWFNKIKDIHNIDDLKYLWRQIKVGLREGVRGWH